MRPKKTLSWNTGDRVIAHKTPAIIYWHVGDVGHVNAVREDIVGDPSVQIIINYQTLWVDNPELYFHKHMSFSDDIDIDSIL